MTLIAQMALLGLADFFLFICVHQHHLRSIYDGNNTYSPSTSTGNCGRTS